MINIYVLQRPGLKNFLKELNKLYEIVIYTATLSLYANSLLDKSDTETYISHRLFREHCTVYKKMIIKDLSKLGRDLKNVIIVDNCPTSYLLQPENAIPIPNPVIICSGFTLKLVMPSNAKASIFLKG